MHGNNTGNENTLLGSSCRSCCQTFSIFSDNHSPFLGERTVLLFFFSNLSLKFSNCLLLKQHWVKKIIYTCKNETINSLFSCIDTILIPPVTTENGRPSKSRKAFLFVKFFFVGLFFLLGSGGRMGLGCSLN